MGLPPLLDCFVGLQPPVEKLQAANASSSFGRDQTRSAFRQYAVDRGLGLRRATTCYITTDRNHTRKRALKAPLRTSVFTAWSLHKEWTQPAPVWQVSLLRTGSGDPGVLAMTRNGACGFLARGMGAKHAGIQSVIYVLVSSTCHGWDIAPIAGCLAGMGLRIKRRAGSSAMGYQPPAHFESGLSQKTPGLHRA
jgi:hypothetical protein